LRRTLIVGNWKMNKTASEAAAFVRELTNRIVASPVVEIVVAPPFTSLESVRTALNSFPAIQLGAQNVFWDDRGAYTGEISAPMLKELGCRYVIIGHSERRSLFGEQDSGIQKKVRAALTHGLNPILCVGESLAERERGATNNIVVRQLTGGLAGLDAHAMASVAIAYEPVWAIGTGKAATVEQATEAHRTIRQCLADTWSTAIAAATRILYGGSVTPQNIGPLLDSKEIDGALIGGACLQIDSFATIASFAGSRKI
jgi:triosephosphate isomerase (TIM)